VEKKKAGRMKGSRPLKVFAVERITHLYLRHTFATGTAVIKIHRIYGFLYLIHHVFILSLIFRVFLIKTLINSRFE
jgi:hypothetical protein